VEKAEKDVDKIENNVNFKNELKKEKLILK